MTDEIDASAPEVEGEIIDAPTAAKIIAPLVAIGATWAVQQGSLAALHEDDGQPPPRAATPTPRCAASSSGPPTTAVAIAVVNVVIDRMTAPRRVQG